MHRGSHRALRDGGEIDMSTGKKTTIGFDRTIHIEWLDIAAARVSRGELPTEIRKVPVGLSRRPRSGQHQQ